MFDTETISAVEAIAARLKIEPAALLAVAEVESNGTVFALVNGRHEPLIRWEGHYFDRRLKGNARDRARAEGLASPTAGAVRNPNGQAARWNLLKRAMRIDKRAALESISIGLGQVMGGHWKKLGFGSVEAMIEKGREGAAGQIDVMARYIDKFDLADELQRLDFTAFARGYNGPAFRKQRYHTKMARAYERISGAPAVSEASGMLRMGSSGAKVRELQALLVRAGHAVRIDGDYGTGTRGAVKAFQKAARIKANGVAGPDTFAKLESYHVSPEEVPGQQAVTEVDEVKQAVGGGVVLTLVTSIRDQIAEGASYLTGVDVGLAQSLASALMAVTAVIGVGLAGYALYGM